MLFNVQLRNIFCIYSTRSNSSNVRQPMMNHHEAMQQIRSDLNRFVTPISQEQQYVRALMNELHVDQVNNLFFFFFFQTSYFV